MWCYIVCSTEGRVISNVLIIYRSSSVLRENRRFLEPERASYRDDRIWEFRNHLELVKERGLGRRTATRQEAWV